MHVDPVKERSLANEDGSGNELHPERQFSRKTNQCETAYAIVILSFAVDRLLCTVLHSGRNARGLRWK